MTPRKKVIVAIIVIAVLVLAAFVARGDEFDPTDHPQWLKDKVPALIQLTNQAGARCADANGRESQACLELVENTVVAQLKAIVNDAKLNPKDKAEACRWAAEWYDALVCGGYGTHIREGRRRVCQ
jgi:hypothetical protein